MKNGGWVDKIFNVVCRLEFSNLFERKIWEKHREMLGEGERLFFSENTNMRVQENSKRRPEGDRSAIARSTISFRNELFYPD